jgi:hypothetical protein
MSRAPLPVRIAIWRRRVVTGSLALFAAAWIAVAGFGRQATSTASTTGSSATQTSAQATDPYSDYYDSQSSATQSDSSGQTNDMSGATTRQS